MRALVLPERQWRQSQQIPRIDRGDVLGAGLIHSWGANVLGTLSAYDAAGSAHGTFGVGLPATSPSGNSWRYDANGPYINYDDSGTGATYSTGLTVGDANGSGSPGNNNTFTIAAQFFINTYYATGGNIGGPQCLYGGNPQSIEFRVNTDGYLQLLKQGTASLGIGSIQVPINQIVTGILSYDNGTMFFVVNGQLAGSANVSPQTFLLATQYFLGYGNVPNSTIERFNNGGRLYRLDVWNRALSLAECKLWNVNPNRAYRSTRQMPYMAAGPALISRRALYLGAQDYYMQAADGATGIKPLVLLNGDIRERIATNQGVPVVLVDGYLKTLAANEVLNV